MCAYTVEKCIYTVHTVYTICTLQVHMSTNGIVINYTGYQTLYNPTNAHVEFIKTN